jgi:hypothetical protein
MGAEKFGRPIALVGLHHLLPQGHPGARIVARARGQLEADGVGFALVGPAELGREQRLVGGVRQARRARVEPEEQAAESDRDLRGHGLRHLLARMLAQGVRDLVPHHDRDLVVGEIQPLDEARVEDDLAAGHAEGVELVAADDVHFPLPRRRVLAEHACLRLDARGDRTHALGQHGIGVEGALVRRLVSQLGVALRRHLLELFGRDEHELLALGAHRAALRRAGAAGELDGGADEQCEQGSGEGRAVQATARRKAWQEGVGHLRGAAWIDPKRLLLGACRGNGPGRCAGGALRSAIRADRSLRTGGPHP